MVPVVADSARKHGLVDDDLVHAFSNPVGSFDLDEGFVMLVGADTSGRLIEVGVVTGSDGPVIVHGMRPARRKFLR